MSPLQKHIQSSGLTISTVADARLLRADPFAVPAIRMLYFSSILPRFGKRDAGLAVDGDG